MTAREARIYELKKLKGRPIKEILQYIFTYFWVHIVLFLVLLVLTVFTITHLTTWNDPALSVCFINSLEQSDMAQDLIRDFTAEAGIDLDQYELDISTAIHITDPSDMLYHYNYQKIVAQMATESLDLVVADVETLSLFFSEYAFCDLLGLLNQEQVERLDESFIYTKQTHTSDAQESIPVAVIIPKSSHFVKTFYPNTQKPIAVGIVVNSRNVNNACAFLEYIMK